jgi:hypothetical protein
VRPRDIAKGEANFVPARLRAIDFDRFSPSFFFSANFIFSFLFLKMILNGSRS